MKDNRKIFIAGLVVTVLVAVVVAQFASSSPDGLEYVAENEGLAAGDHELADTPLADYGEGLTDSDPLNTAIAGLVGVVATLGLGYGVFWLARKTNRDKSTSELS